MWSVTVTAAPTADAGAATGETCSNSDYTAAATATDASSILWTTSGDGSFADDSIEDAVYTPGAGDITAGTVTLTMTVSGNGTCSDVSDNIIITVTAAPTADAGAATGETCSNSDYTASATATNASSILWTTSGDGSFADDSIEDAVYTPGAGDITAGTVTLTMTVSGNGTCSDVADNVVVTVTAAPTADAGAATGETCSNSDYTAAATATDASSILWTTSGDGSFADDSIEDAVYTPGAGDITAGTVTLTMTVSGNGTCSDVSDNIIITVTTAPTADAGAATGETCSNSDYTAAATATDASSISWTTSGDGSFADDSIEDAVYTPGAGDITAGTVTLTMTVSGNGTCADVSDNWSVTVTAAPTADAGAATGETCSNSDYTAAATATDASSISWTTSGDGSFADDSIEDAVYTPGARGYHGRDGDTDDDGSG